MVPFVSIIMPVRNEAKFIERSLGAMLRQTYPHDRYEVLVVDGMSTDGTRDLVTKLAAAADVPVRLLDNRAQIVPPAMNLGLRAAQGEFIVRMDGHTIAAHDYVAACIDALARTGADNVGGCIVTSNETWVGRAIALVMSSPLGVGDAKHRYATQEQEVDTVPFGAWPRTAFARFGYFDESFVRTQDSEFNYRTRMLGGRIFMCPGIRSTYYARTTFAGLVRQYFEYGFWKTRLMFKLGRRLMPRHFAAPLLTAGLLGSLVALVLGGLLGAWWLLVPGVPLPLVYGTFVGVGGLYLAVRARALHLLPFIWLTFPLLHLSWGTGFLLGLLHRPAPGLFAPLPDRSETSVAR